MGKRRTPWFWNTAILARVAWLLLVVVFAAYASRTLLFTASVSPVSYTHLTLPTILRV